jgi:hypothetical protein
MLRDFAEVVWGQWVHVIDGGTRVTYRNLAAYVRRAHGFAIAGLPVLVLLTGCAGAPSSSRSSISGPSASDRDGDGLSNDRETTLGTNPDVADTDGDGISDGAEVAAGTNPLARDSDGDGLLDGADPEPTSFNAPSTNGSRSTGQDLEPNDFFAQPVTLALRDLETVVVNGLIDRDADVDVYDIGALSAGDHLDIEVVRTSGTLDPDVALFDAQQRLYAENDDGNEAGAGDSALLQLDLRRTSPRYFVVVSRSPDASNRGGYRMLLTLMRAAAVPAPQAQVAYLNFNGGQVSSPLLGMMTLTPFDAGDIARAYRGQSDVIKAGIVATVRQNYARFHVIVRTSDDGPEPDPPFSTLYFGGLSATVFGLAEDVDVFNFDFCDDGQIYTESFAPSVFLRTPSAQDLAVAIGNVASHELGHLLGLNHVRNALDLMDAASPADTLLHDQEFLESPLDERIFPIGRQDSSLLLTETVGSP